MPLKIEILSIMIGYEANSHKSNIKSHALRPTPYIDYPIYFQVSPLSLYLAIASPLHYSYLQSPPPSKIPLSFNLSSPREVVQKTYNKISFLIYNLAYPIVY